MNEAKALLKNVRISPRKARLVVDLIRGKRAEEALAVLRFTQRHAARVVSKLLKSAVANAVFINLGDVDRLWVSKAYVDAGPSFKRMRAGPMGRSKPILKRTSRITLVVSEKQAL